MTCTWPLRKLRFSSIHRRPKNKKRLITQKLRPCQARFTKNQTHFPPQTPTIPNKNNQNDSSRRSHYLGRTSKRACHRSGAKIRRGSGGREERWGLARRRRMGRWRGRRLNSSAARLVHVFWIIAAANPKWLCSGNLGIWDRIRF